MGASQVKTHVLESVATTSIESPSASSAESARNVGQSRCSNLMSMWCLSCKGWGILLMLYVVQVFLLNLLCFGSVGSPFFSVSANLETGIAFLLVTLPTMILIAAVVNKSSLAARARAAQEKTGDTCGQIAVLVVPSTQYIAPALGVMIVYCIGLALMFVGSKATTYPGALFELPSEIKPVQDDLVGEEFYFRGNQEEQLHAYRVMYGAKGAGSTPDQATDAGVGAQVVPVVMLGGNAGSAWSNTGVGNMFLSQWYTHVNSSVVFDVFAFSFRGYAPNDAYSLLDINEKNMVGDSMSLIKEVQTRYPEHRVLLMSYSLGTGPASAITSQFSDSDLACVGLGMPWSTFSQTALEYSMYTTIPFYFVFDTWPNAERVAQMSPGIPLVVLSAGQDKIIAPHHQQTVADRARSVNKKLFFMQNASHAGIAQIIDHNLPAYLEWFRACMDRVNK